MGDDEIMIFASADSVFIKSAVVPRDHFRNSGKADLLNWEGGLDLAIASYSIGGPHNDVSVSVGAGIWPSQALNDARPLVFSRHFEGWRGSGQSYFELLQEYSHIVEIHWRPEEHAYCRFDNLGDLEHVVSVTSREDNQTTKLDLITFKRQPLEQYIAASDFVLVRMFDFMMLKKQTFTGWGGGAESVFPKERDFFYQQEYIAGRAGYIRGVQIVELSRAETDVLSSIVDHAKKDYVEFLSFDFRNNEIADIPTEPSATTNYYEAHVNKLPYETSPSFFRSEVLLRYTADRDKYTFAYRSLHCRDAWEIKYDVNEAFQVHVYICDLRRLPFEEQLYWKSFNEPPKATISERAFRHDFEGEWIDLAEPIEDIQSTLRRWHARKVSWWE